jgi:glucosamine-6-phosphate deaminase
MQLHIYPDKTEMAAAASAWAADGLRAALAARGEARLILATGASQFEMVAGLVAQPGIQWEQITAFHLDEYAGLPASHPASFRRYLRGRFADLLPLKEFHYVQGDAPDLHAECRRLGALIAAAPVDVACVGIGENGHLAFNDPPADFDTHEPYILVDLDAACRQQQVGEGWFASLEDVPRQAISMSIYQIMLARQIVCTVPDARKAQAVRGCAAGPVTPHCPSSILQCHPSCDLFLNHAAAALLPA